MKTLYGLVVLAALLGGGLAGYRVGAWSLDGARAQLAALEEAAEQARRTHEAMREKLQRELGALEVEHERQVARMGQTFQAEKLALQRSLASSTERISAVDARRQQLDGELNRTRMARETATGELEAELQKKEQALRKLQEELENARAGLACLSIAVPADEIRILNGNHTQVARIP